MASITRLRVEMLRRPPVEMTGGYAQVVAAGLAFQIPGKSTRFALSGLGIAVDG